MSLFTLYRFYAADDTLLYVGLTTNPGSRFKQHSHGKQWWVDVAHVRMEHHGSLEALRKAEREAIRAEKPLHNIALNGGTKAERRQALRDNGWHRVSAHGAESWTHKERPGITFTLAGAWTTANIRLTPAQSPSPAEKETDGLVGRWFHSYRELEPDEERSPYSTIRGGYLREWQGQIVDRDGDVFVAQLYSWWDGQPTNEVIVEADDMKLWRFFATNEQMLLADGCVEPLERGSADNRICGAPCTHVIRNFAGGYAQIYRCADCIRFYSGKVEKL